MNAATQKRLEALQGQQVHLQSQCYLMKKGLDMNELQLDKVATVIAELESQKKWPSGEAQEEKPTEPGIGGTESVH